MFKITYWSRLLSVSTKICDLGTNALRELLREKSLGSSSSSLDSAALEIYSFLFSLNKEAIL